MLIKKIFLSFIILFIFFNLGKASEIKIVTTVGNQIITNIDIYNERNYLLLLNKNLNKISKEELANLAKNSLVREKIKRKEINRVFDEQIDKLLKDKVIENYYKRLGLNNQNELIKLLNEKNLAFDDLVEKLLIETKWNRLIYIKFNDKIKIDKNEIKTKIKDIYNNQKKNYEYNLSEILIDVENYKKLKKDEISNYIKKFGFKITANKYSKSDTSKYGGEIGWIKEARLSKTIKEKISQIEVGDIAETIESPNGYLILKLNDKREITKKLNLEKELEQQIVFEKNRQLNQFSLNYYKKLKQNIIIYENK